MWLSVHKLLHDLGCTPASSLLVCEERLPAVSPVWRIRKKKPALPGDVEVCQDHEPCRFVDQRPIPAIGLGGPRWNDSYGSSLFCVWTLSIAAGTEKIADPA